MQNKLANTNSYLARHFIRNAADSVEEKRKTKRQKDNQNKGKRKKDCRWMITKKEFWKLLLVIVMRNKAIYP